MCVSRPPAISATMGIAATHPDVCGRLGLDARRQQAPREAGKQGVSGAGNIHLPLEDEGEAAWDPHCQLVQSVREATCTQQESILPSQRAHLLWVNRVAAVCHPPRY